MCSSVDVGACLSVFVSELSGLVSQQHPQLAALLSCIQFASVAVVNLQYRSDVLPVKVHFLSVTSLIVIEQYQQFAKFRPGRGTAVCNSTVSRKILQEFCPTALLISNNLSRVYHGKRICTFLWQVQRNFGEPVKLVCLLEEFYSNLCVSTVRMDENLTELFNNVVQLDSVKQGCNL